jgi:hypothetical protein
MSYTLLFILTQRINILSNPDDINERFSSVKTDLLIGWIFSAIFVVVWAIFFAEYIFNDLIGSGLISIVNGSRLSSSYFTGYLIVGIFFLIWIIPTIVITRRLGSMYRAISSGNITRLKEANTQSWAIVALVFAGVIPGIMLLVAYGPINMLSEAPNPNWSNPAAGNSVEEQLAKLKGLFDSGAITKLEYDQQKQLLLNKL